MTQSPNLGQPKEDNERKLGEKKSESKTPLLDYYGRNLNEMASNGMLDPVYGREKEIKDIVNILNKRKKNNPIIIGDEGVGKTVLVEALAQRIVAKEVEMWLLDKVIIEINISNMVSGTKYRGEFEQRMEGMIKEIENNPHIIIFIDEIHNIIGAGGTSGSLDAANMIKPSLSRGTMKCIGATTLSEYKKHIEGEGAFARRFQKVYIKEPTKEETVDLLMNIKKKYEKYHGVEYSKEVIKFCVELVDKYVNNRKFPDKAIDLLDEAGSMVKLSSSFIPEELIEKELELIDITNKKKNSSNNQLFEEAAEFRDMEKEILASLLEIKERTQKEFKENTYTVELEHLAKIMASHSGIPLEKLTSAESSRLKELEENLNSQIIGQDEAIKKVSESIQRARLGFSDPSRPTASFLFLGSTGVGKTYLAKILAEDLFDTSDSFIRIDMSEFEAAFSISKLIGSPPGYIGHDDKGQLTEKIKNRPYSLVLFDEIEKAHPDVLNALLQILDDGKLTDATGVEVNFKNTIIIMTSNVGTKNIIEDSAVGFGVDRNVLSVDKSSVFKEIEKQFRPEFINRIDEKIVFNPLGEEQIKLIVDIEMKKAIDRVIKKGYDVTCESEVNEYIAEHDFNKKYGARPIKRAIADRIINLITRKILDGHIKEGGKFKIVVEKDEIKIIKQRKHARAKSE